MGFSPLDEQLEVRDAHWSAEVVRLAVWLSSMLSFGEASAVLGQVGGVEIPVSSLWRRTQQWGRRMGEVQAHQSVVANALPFSASTAYSGRGGQCKRMGVALDGVIIPIREEGWKELKFGTLFAVTTRAEKDPVTHEIVPMGHAVSVTCVAHLGGAETLGERVWAEARRRRWEEAQDTIALGDGAAWIWNQVDLHFGDSIQLVDWYHAKSHLHSAARLLHPESSPAHQRWLNRQSTRLYQGHAAALAQELHAAAATHPDQNEGLRQVAGYFQTHAHRMHYLEQREALWPIGSGVVESTAKQLKRRFCGAGMRWSRTGAVHMATIRSATLSRNFNQIWADAYALPLN